MSKCEGYGSALGFMPTGKFDKLACIPDYDAGEPSRTASGRRVVRFVGTATYEVIDRCEHGCAYHCKRIWHRPKSKRSRERYAARVRALAL